MKDANILTIVICVLVGVFAITQFVLNQLKDIIIGRYKEILEAEHKRNAAALEYCYKHIMKSYIDNEDYEAANEILKTLDELENKKTHK